MRKSFFADADTIADGNAGDYLLRLLMLTSQKLRATFLGQLQTLNRCIFSTPLYFLFTRCVHRYLLGTLGFQLSAFVEQTCQTFL